MLLNMIYEWLEELINKDIKLEFPERFMNDLHGNNSNYSFNRINLWLSSISNIGFLHL